MTEELSKKNSFERALNSWSLINLPNLQKELDLKGIQIKETQDESLAKRKELAVLTKSFKKLDDTEKLSQFNSLLKSYQNEIDTLTKKNKSVESTFFQIYRTISEAPDPKPLLQMSIDAVSSFNEIDKLKQEKMELEEKLLKFSDYDQLKNNLAKLESNLNSLHESKLKAKEMEMNSILNEREINFNKEKSNLINENNKLVKDIEDLKISKDILSLKLKNQLKTLNNSEDDESGENQVNINLDNLDKLDDTNESSEQVEELKQQSINSVELDLLNRDTENAKLRIKELEKRNEQLLKDLSISKSNIENDELKNELNNKISNLENENIKLISRLGFERSKYDSLKKDNESTLNKVKALESSYQSQIETLSKRIHETVDYDDIKKELQLIKSIEFGQDEDNEDDEDLDSSLMQRNKKLSNEIITLRSKFDSLTNENKALRDKLDLQDKEIEALKDINNKIEIDLLNIDNHQQQQQDNNKWETMSMISSIAPSVRNPSIVRAPSIASFSTNMNNSGRLSPASSIVNGIDPNASHANNVQQDNSILPIITQQRDRFRIKNKELEEESKKQFTKILEFKREINNLKNDNKELYERIRFLQFKTDNQNNLAKQQAKSQPLSTKPVDSSTVDLENRYRESYENQLHPIEQFREMETKRINSRMTPFERIFIQLTKAVLSSNQTRLIFAIYSVCIHLLLLVFLFSFMGHSTTVITQPVSAAGSRSTGGVANGVSGGAGAGVGSLNLI